MVFILSTKSHSLSMSVQVSTSADPEGDRGPHPPGKSQVLWVSIEISKWMHLKKLDPPEKVGPPLENVGPH